MRLFDRMRQQKALSTILLLFTLTLGILIGTVINTGVHAARDGQAVAPDATPLVVPTAAQTSNEFTQLARRLGPSVVNITADYTPKETARGQRFHTPSDEDDSPSGSGSGDEDGSDLLHKFFKNNPGGSGGSDVSPRMFRREQSGSGFIVDHNGYIITNNHVVDKVDKIKVKLHGDETEYRARLIGFDRETDLAVIKIDPHSSLPAVNIGNSDALQVGDWAVAIGSPFGLEASVTAGIVSATGRDIGTQQFQRFIQTDAAINPGNSGGPLANIRGEVIGVNTMIATQSGGYQGIGFALPINMAVKVYNDIIKNGRVVRGSIGIGWSKASEKPDLLKALGVSHGVLVGQVTKGGPAERAGMKPEDIITTYNGKPVQGGDDLLANVANSPVGSTSTISVNRGGKVLDLKVAIEDRAETLKNDPRYAVDEPASETPSKPAGASSTTRFGMKIRVMNDTDRSSPELKDKKGVVVVAVDTDSFADDLGLLERDVIVSINRENVSSPDDVQRIQSSLKPGEAVAIHVYRGNGRLGGSAPSQSLFLSGAVPAK
jgi:serine protease Do